MATRTDLPLVAVTTPVYNGAAFLAETMECVQAQTYPNLVHCLVDNASTDETPAIIERYRGGRVPLIVVRNADTLKQMPNWNRAIELIPADAKYFRLLCADDTITPDAIEKMVALAETDDEIGIVGSYQTRTGGHLDTFGWPKDRQVFDGKEALRAYFRNQAGIWSVHTLMRRTLLDVRPSFFNEDYHLFDVELFVVMLQHCKFGFLHEDLAFTREHEGSVSSTVLYKSNIHFFEWMKWLLTEGPNFLSAAEIEETETRFRRYYLRKCLRWRLGETAPFVKKHIEALDRIGRRPTLSAYADATLDWVFVKAGLREGWRGFPA
jgi:glycosyltransferase involved in cell wall biosynthesis